MLIGRISDCFFVDVDLVVHAAGPFEYLDCNVLEAAIESKVL